MRPEGRRPQKHLLDPDNLQPRRSARGGMSVTRVQQWVVSSLVVTTVLHLAVGLVVAGLFLDAERPGAQEGLMVIAGIFMVLSLAAARLVHGRSPLTPWLLLGLLPTVVGLWLLHGR